MYVVIRQYTLDPGSIDEIIRRAKEGFVPIIQSIPGFVGYTIGVSMDGTQATTFSAFQDRASADESVRKAADWVRANLADLTTSPPTVFGGEVKILKRKEGVEPRFGVRRRYMVNPGDVAEIARRAEEGFVPIITQAPGFGTYVMIDEGDGHLTTLSSFESQAGSEESVRMAADWIKENLASLVPNPPEVAYGEIKLRVLAPMPADTGMAAGMQPSAPAQG
jgi:hypothetical protein